MSRGRRNVVPGKMLLLLLQTGSSVWRAIRGGCTNSYNFRLYANAFSRTSRSPASLCLFALRSRLSLCMSSAVTLGMQMTAHSVRKLAHAYAHETRAQPLPMPPIHMHFNVRSFNDLHNEVICSSLPVCAAVGFSRNGIRK